MKFRLLKTDIPVYDFSFPGEVVRYLKSEDLDGNLYHELIHDNLERIMLDSRGKLSFSVKATPSTYLSIKPGRKYNTGFQGVFSLASTDTGNDLELQAVWFAIGVLTNRVGNGLYENYFGKARWKTVALEEESDRHVTVQVGEESHTFYFKRLWENEERKDIAEIVKYRKK